MSLIETIRNFRDPAAWDDFVSKHPQGRFAQLWGYRSVRDAYGYTPHYLAFLRDGELAAVLPLFEARSLLFGRRFLSQPFIEYGGFLVDDAVTAGEWSGMLDGVLDLMAERRVEALEIHGTPGCSLDDGRLAAENQHELAVLELDRPAEEIWQQVISRHVRKAVRKAEREGLSVTLETRESDIREHFYPLYVRSMLRLGSIPHPLSYFTGCFRAFGERMRCVWALHGGQRVACLVGFECGGRISITNIASDERYWHLRPNDLVHWELVRDSAERGLTHFDFGSVRYDGQSQYKKKWGCLHEPRAYYFLRREQAEQGTRTFDSSGSAVKLAGKLWSKAIPAFAAGRIGPAIRRQLMR